MEEEIVEECPRCEGTGVVEGSMAFVSLCETCNGACYVPHACAQEEE